MKIFLGMCEYIDVYYVIFVYMFFVVEFIVFLSFEVIRGNG